MQFVLLRIKCRRTREATNTKREGSGQAGRRRRRRLQQSVYCAVRPIFQSAFLIRVRPSGDGDGREKNASKTGITFQEEEEEKLFSFFPRY